MDLVFFIKTNTLLPSQKQRLFLFQNNNFRFLGIGMHIM